MSEMEPEQAGIDRVLRRSLGAPEPRLPAKFEKRLMEKLEQKSPARARYRRALLAGYGVLSVVTCAALMRGQGLDWGTVAMLTLGPLAVAVTVPWVRRAARANVRRSAQ